MQSSYIRLRLVTVTGTGESLKTHGERWSSQERVNEVGLGIHGFRLPVSVEHTGCEHPDQHMMPTEVLVHDAQLCESLRWVHDTEGMARRKAIGGCLAGKQSFISSEIYYSFLVISFHPSVGQFPLWVWLTSIRRLLTRFTHRIDGFCTTGGWLKQMLNSFCVNCVSP